MKKMFLTLCFILSIVACLPEHASKTSSIDEGVLSQLIEDYNIFNSAQKDALKNSTIEYMVTKNGTTGQYQAASLDGSVIKIEILENETETETKIKPFKLSIRFVSAANILLEGTIDLDDNKVTEHYTPVGPSANEYFEFDVDLMELAQTSFFANLKPKEETNDPNQSSACPTGYEQKDNPSFIFCKGTDYKLLNFKVSCQKDSVEFKDNPNFELATITAVSLCSNATNGGTCTPVDLSQMEQIRLIGVDTVHVELATNSGRQECESKFTTTFDTRN